MKLQYSPLSKMSRPVLLGIGVLAILLQYQNCAPVGESLEQVAATAGDIGELATGGGGTTPSDPGTMPPEEQTPIIPPIDVCKDNKTPSLVGQLNGVLVTSSVKNQSVTIGIGEGSGTILPSDIRIVGSPGEGETQALSLNCDVSPGGILDVDCDNNDFSNVDGQYRATISMNQDDSTQCQSGTVFVKFSAQDSCDAESPQTLSFSIKVKDGCLPEQKKTAWTDSSMNAKFGYDVDIYQNTAVVAAPNDGENGYQSGAAYVFNRVNGKWENGQKLMVSSSASANGGDLGDVAIHGNTIVVGVPYHNGTGAVFVFKNSNGAWTQSQEILVQGGNVDGGDEFGFSVDVSSNYLIVGSRRDKTQGVQAGAAYIYKMASGKFAFEGKIIQPGGAARHLFGHSVAVSGSTVIVGAPISSVYKSLGPGSAHIFRKDTNGWVGTTLAYTGGAAGDQFGTSVDISGTRAVVGAPKRATGTKNARTGGAFVFAGTNYGTQIRLESGATTFGTRVAIDGNEVLVGAPRANLKVGSAAYYVIDGSKNQTKSRFVNLARDRRAEDQFGQGVALSGGTAIIGAWIDDIVKSETKNGVAVDNAGSVYFIELP